MWTKLQAGLILQREANEMGEWTDLSEVEDVRVAGQTFSFPLVVAWIANFQAPNPYPQKFVYAACPFKFASGKMCAKSLEFGPRCDHELPCTFQSALRSSFFMPSMEGASSTC